LHPPLPLQHFSFPYALLRLPAFVPSSILLPICFAVSPSCVRGIAVTLSLSRVAASPRSLYFLTTLIFVFDLVAILSAHNTPFARYCIELLLQFLCRVMTTSPAPTVIEFARHAASNLTTFSGAYLLTSARLQRTAAFLSAGTPLMLKNAILGDPSLTIQWMAVANGRTVVLTRPVVATDATSVPIYLASLGDDLAQATPVALATSIATDMVVTLVRHADAVALGLPGCAAVPGQLDPPPNGDGVVDQAGIDRLHFDASGGDSDAPVFAVLPSVYPLALGEVPFLQSITDPLDNPATLSCGARVWFDGLRYLATFNAGRSIRIPCYLMQLISLRSYFLPAIWEIMHKSLLLPSTLCQLATAMLQCCTARQVMALSSRMPRRSLPQLW
jgi:hypothetical protein